MYSSVSFAINVKVIRLNHPESIFEWTSLSLTSESPGVGPGRCVKEKFPPGLRITGLDAVAQ